MQKAEITKILNTDPQTIFTKRGLRGVWGGLFTITDMKTDHNGQTRVYTLTVFTDKNGQLYTPTATSAPSGVGSAMVNQVGSVWATTMAEAQERHDIRIATRDRISSR